MIVGRWGAMALATILFGACRLPLGSQAVGYDAFARAEAARDRGALTEALCAFDEVDPADPRYASARLQSAALEQRLRRQQELVAQGLRLRSEWRGEEAIAAFRAALQAWPEDDRAAQLLRATERRGQALAGARSDDAANSNGGVVAAGDASATDLDAHAAPIGEIAPAARAHDAIGAQLARLEARLQRGSLDSVMTEMQRLHDAHPGDARLCSRLARLLLQRGLLHYGRGEVQAAVEDWRRARKLDPNLQGVSQLLDAASHELGRPPR